MFKKIALASILIATASFASWDLFPVLPKHQGEAQVSVNHQVFNSQIYNYANKAYEPYNQNSLSVNAQARFSVIQNLELGLSLSYRFYTEAQYSDVEADGLGNLTFMARYQFLPKMNVFFDVTAPTGDESYNYYSLMDVWSFAGGLQFSTPVNSMVNLGSELGLTLDTRSKREKSNLGITASVETDFTVLPQFTPYIGANLLVDLGTFNSKDGYELSEGGQVGTWVTVGTKLDLSQRLNLNASYGFGIGDHYFKGELNNYKLELGIKF